MPRTPQPDAAPHILYVDDEHLLHGVIDRLFSREGIQVTACASALDAVEALKERTFDLVITDFKMPEMDGLELLAHIREEYPETRVIMITAHANVQHAVGAMRGGAVDYIAKPFSTQVLLERVQTRLAEEPAAAAPAGDAAPSKSRRRVKGKKAEPKKVAYIGEHPAVQQLKALLPRVAQSRAPVFVHGESGTGKEILSRLVHQESDRADGPYVTLNCANLPRELVESHLFGHRKGAFTGAIEDMTGAFEQADGGTLLLDEITEIELPVQAKLLRVLQEQEFTKVGSNEPQKVDVRVVATSNRDLQTAIDEGIFRADLYHRLAVFPLYVPPLRERLSDLPRLAQHFADKYASLYELPEKTISPALLARFQSYAWPGNVRQLENMIHRGVVLAADRTEVEPGDVMNTFFSDGMGAQAATPAGSGPVGVAADGTRLTLAEVERLMIEQALGESGGNQQQAAEALGICARTIRNKLKKYRQDDAEAGAAVPV
jgi:DNA-binding NtrC family response regulator